MNSSSKQELFRMYSTYYLDFTNTEDPIFKVNFRKVDRPEYFTEFSFCECGDPIPTPVAVDTSYHKFKILVLSSNKSEFERAYSVVNSVGEVK